MVRPLIGWRASWLVRTGFPLLIVVAAATVAVYLLRPVDPNAPNAAPDQAAPVGPSSSQVAPAPAAAQPDPATAAPPTPPRATVTITTRPTAPGDPPAAPGQAEDPTQPTRPVPPTFPGTTPSSSVTPPPPEEPHIEKVNLPGEAPIYCPMPYVGTHYGPLAQCTQRDGDQVRTGFYSPFAMNWNPTSGWATVVDTNYHDRTVLAADGVQGTTRGYGAINTHYGAAVMAATQYRPGEGRWGTINLVTGQFYPGSVGWLPAAF